MRTIRILLPALALALAGGLALPAAAQGGVTLFEHTDFGGVSQSFTADVARLGGTRIGNDRVSSVRVAPGCVATLYADADFRGRTTVLRGDAAHLGTSEIGNDATSSLRVACGSTGPHGVTLFTDSEYRGRQATFYGDMSDLTHDGYPNDATSSVRVPDGCSLTLYEHTHYRGRSETLYEDDPLLANNRIGNDVASSLRVVCRGTAVGGPVTPPPPFRTSGVFRCDDGHSGIAFRVSETGRERGRAALLLADTEVATFQAQRVGNAYELRPVGGAGGTVRLDLTRNEITVGMNGSQRTLCRWR